MHLEIMFRYIMLKYATVKIGYKGKASFKSRYNYYKPALSSKIAYLKNASATGSASNFDCDVMEITGNCLSSFVLIEDVPLNIEICKKCSRDYCKFSVKT